MQKLKITHIQIYKKEMVSSYSIYVVAHCSLPCAATIKVQANVRIIYRLLACIFWNMINPILDDK